MRSDRVPRRRKKKFLLHQNLSRCPRRPGEGVRAGGQVTCAPPYGPPETAPANGASIAASEVEIEHCFALVVRRFRKRCLVLCSAFLCQIDRWSGAPFDGSPRLFHARPPLPRLPIHQISIQLGRKRGKLGRDAQEIERLIDNTRIYSVKPLNLKPKV